MKLLLLFAILGSSTIWGNPIIVYEDKNGPFTTYIGRKSLEECIAFVGTESSVVSCKVTYRLKRTDADAPSTHVHIALPVFISAQETLTNSELESIIAPSVVYAETRYTPENQTTRSSDTKYVKYYETPEGTDLVWFRYLIPVGARQREATFLVTYSQPTLEDRFLYMPLFEEGRSPRGFEITIISSDSGIHLSRRDSEGEIHPFLSRAEIPLCHKEIIEIQIEDANK